MTPPRALVLAALAALTATAAPAAAQSKRYPRPPVDHEAAAEARSDFWEEVVRPGARRYEDLLAKATDTMRNVNNDTTRSREYLVEATALRPDLVDAWGYLGVAAERQRDWSACAAAYGRAFRIDPRWRPARLAAKHDTSPQAKNRANRPLELGWAMCLSRAGDLARAATAVEAVVARGEATPEAWLRLGEVYMAEGRLAEAITALDQARNDPPLRGYARWLLAVAHDRARRPAEAEAAAAEAGDVENATRGPIPFVPAADVHYVRAFAARNAPERALALYRTYLALAPADSPWRARAEEHLEALANLDLAARVDIEGTADRATVERAARNAMPALRACVATVPTAVVQLRITQVGPPGKPPRPPRFEPPRARPLAPPSMRGPPRAGARLLPLPPPRPYARSRPEDQTPGVSATALVAEPATTSAEDFRAAAECVEKVGQSLTLPRPAAGTYATVRIPVVADR